MSDDLSQLILCADCPLRATQTTGELGTCGKMAQGREQVSKKFNNKQQDKQQTLPQAELFLPVSSQKVSRGSLVGHIGRFLDYMNVILKQLPAPDL